MSSIRNLHNGAPSLQNLLTMARDVLMAQQSSMSVIGNNVSNVNTPGYSRQRTAMGTRPALDGNPGQFGTGVSVTEIERISDAFIVDRVRYEHSSMGRWQSQYESMMEVEQVLGEIGQGGISDALDNFWLAWEELANQPDDRAPRLNLISRSEQLSSTLQGAARNLNDMQARMNRELRSHGDDINRMASEVARLNREISTAQIRGQNPNQLLDERDRVLNELSTIAGVTVEFQDNGSANVYIGRSVLVMDDRTREINWLPENGIGKDGGNLYWADNNQAVEFEEGEAFAKIQMRDVHIPQALADLDDLANTIRDRVNELHLQGVGRDGSLNNYFWDPNGEGADDLQISQHIIENPDRIAASRISPTGDNALAHEIFELQQAAVLENGTMSFSDFYHQTVSRVATNVQDAEIRMASAAAGLEQAETWREQVSGVSIDEEMANLLLVQRSYSATSRVLRQADEMISTVLAMVG
ncbi:flagellar hook-associated protein FlgK [bacterium]|nr:flagellar hook-associated protein FlgK [bacterium]